MGMELPSTNPFSTQKGEERKSMGETREMWKTSEISDLEQLQAHAIGPEKTQTYNFLIERVFLPQSNSSRYPFHCRTGSSM